jgi:hypothetical protein
MMKVGRKMGLILRGVKKTGEIYLKISPIEFVSVYPSV